MSTVIHNLNVLPFYDDLRYQNHKKEYAYDEVYKLYSPSTRLLPFQIIRPHATSTPITSVLLKGVDRKGNPNGSETDITAQVTGSGLTILEFSADGYDIIKYPSTFAFPALTIGLGQYFIEVTDGTNTWYSEIFTIVSNPEKLLRLVYTNYDDIETPDGKIDYTQPFSWSVYLDTKLGKPRYTIEEEAKVRDGFTYYEKQLSEKRYVFEFMAPEFLLDALRIVRLHDVVRVFYDGLVYDCEVIFIEPRWQEQGDLAAVTVEFGVGSVIKKTGGGFIRDAGDFGDDFNDDFFNI